MSFETRIPDYQQRTEDSLERWLCEAGPAPRLQEAMRYAVLGGGKRIRPLLVYASAESLGLAPERMDGVAAAVELIHAYSLAHDDLPAMDDDDLRRGRPTCHRAYDEATAILAGDALQALALRILAEDASMQADADARLSMVRTLTAAAGDQGMAGGQMLDLEAEGAQLELDALERIHRLKTGALIAACVTMPAALVPDLAPERAGALARYGEQVGLAFQVKDDIIDVEGEPELIGKTPGADAARDKPTYVTLLGLDGARSQARSLRDTAIAALDPFGGAAEPLAALADLIVGREH